MNIALKSNIWKFYLIAFLGIRFITPIRIIYLLSFGLSFAQIGMMELAAAIVIVLLEIPSGIFADIVGRKASRLIAYALSILAFSLLSFGSTASIFILGWALSGAADAFESGAQNALIFDTLKVLGKEKNYIKVKSHFLLINTFAVIVGSILGAKFYLIDPRLPWYLITIMMVISAFVFSTVKEPYRSKKSQAFKKHLSDFKNSFSLSISKIDVKRLLVLGLVLALPMYVFTTILNQPYFLSRGFTMESLGITFAVITGVSGLISFFTPKIESKLKKRYSFLVIFISFTLLLLLLGFIKDSIALGLVIIFTIVDNYKNILIDNYINQEIDSKSRATLLSVQSFINNIVISILFVFIGYLVDIWGIDFVLISMGTFIGLSSIPFLVIYKKVR